jgi:hypothetical protein
VELTATVVLVVDEDDVLVVVLLLVLELELLDVVVVSTQLTPQALPVPITAPPTAVQRDSSAIRDRVFPGRQHTTADGRPQVERAAQRTMPRISRLKQRLLLSVLRKWATQRTYSP